MQSRAGERCISSMASQVNGPTGMYGIKPFFDTTNSSIELPTCMYKVKNYHNPIEIPEQVWNLLLWASNRLPSVLST